ncbi:MAG: hypothetical protein Q9161_001662 [Pseudevernia consocians]
MPNNRKRKGDPREVEVSKSLSYLLRHGAKAEGIQLDDAGWANVADVLLWRRIASLEVDLSGLQTIVATNDKKRYQIEPDPAGPLRAPSSRTSTTSATDPANWRIRATQGHSITTVSNEQMFEPILLTDADCPDYVVHGTDDLPWKRIERTGGLKPMSRKHIHFATKLPDAMPPLDPVFQSRSRPKEEGDVVISGIRATSTVVIWVDVKASLRAGVQWWRSANGVVLTEGVGEEKMLGLEWCKWAERRGSGEILYGEKVESGDVMELEKRMNRLGVGLGGGEGGSRDMGDGGKAPQEKRSGEKLGQGVMLKDNWDD